MEKELTILIPALNEEQTIGICVKKAKKFMEINNINGEILVADNYSKDRTAKLAKELGARIIEIPQKGYGNALIAGSTEAKGKYTIIGDADNSYNFLEVLPILEELRSGYDLVIGNRYKGNLEKGSMKFSHKYIGTPIISLLGRLIHNIDVGDFNCGLRGYNTQKMNKLGCKSSGMEYASEMLIKSKRAN